MQYHVQRVVKIVSVRFLCVRVDLIHVLYTQRRKCKQLEIHQVSMDCQPPSHYCTVDYNFFGGFIHPMSKI